MELIVNSSSSKGNSYLLKSQEGTLALEAGFPMVKSLVDNDIDISQIVGCLITHEHGDHAKYALAYAKMGVDIYASTGTLEAIGAVGHRFFAINSSVTKIGDFSVISFMVKHDAAEPVGFLIHHHEMGTCLFITDTWYCPYKFKGLTQMIVEANYDEGILTENLHSGVIHSKVYNRVRESHMEISTLKTLLIANDLSLVSNIVLIHLSSQNSDADRFQRDISELTGKNILIAKSGMRIPFNKTPF